MSVWVYVLERLAECIFSPPTPQVFGHLLDHNWYPSLIYLFSHAANSSRALIIQPQVKLPTRTSASWKISVTVLADIAGIGLDIHWIAVLGGLTFCHY
ncbi:hypothetical protein BDW59DRAFT_54099 [Aspergillus cavernicola]|uniref:Amino acid permease/ SLC12A domain-containing protein n=1 Tax=Aspergillus cavernicola TaxID=176166 RepID=A0ABR4H8N7_9EURO